jgi:hypothetical protein
MERITAVNNSIKEVNTANDSIKKEKPTVKERTR